MAKLESAFEREVCKKIKSWDKDIWVMKNDPNIIQGFPDRVVYYRERYAMLEFKKNKKASHRPNQDWYVNHFNEVSFGRFIYPENEDEVLEELYEYLFN